ALLRPVRGAPAIRRPGSPSRARSRGPYKTCLCRRDRARPEFRRSGAWPPVELIAQPWSAPADSPAAVTQTAPAAIDFDSSCSFDLCPFAIAALVQDQVRDRAFIVFDEGDLRVYRVEKKLRFGFREKLQLGLANRGDNQPVSLFGDFESEAG